MANTAITFYSVVQKKGGVNQLKELFDIMHKLQCMKSPGLVKNAWGQTWLGNLVYYLGGDYDAIYCRGKWGGLKLEDDVLCFYAESAWKECAETRHFLESKYPQIKLYYYAEEEDSDMFESNDIQHKFYNVRYKVEIGDEIKEFNNAQDLYDWSSTFFGRDFHSISEIENYAETWMENLERQGVESWLKIRIIKYINN